MILVKVQVKCKIIELFYILSFLKSQRFYVLGWQTNQDLEVWIHNSSLTLTSYED